MVWISAARNLVINFCVAPRHCEKRLHLLCRGNVFTTTIVWISKQNGTVQTEANAVCQQHYLAKRYSWITTRITAFGYCDYDVLKDAAAELRFIRLLSRVFCHASEVSAANYKQEASKYCSVRGFRHHSRVTANDNLVRIVSDRIVDQREIQVFVNVKFSPTEGDVFEVVVKGFDSKKKITRFNINLVSDRNRTVVIESCPKLVGAVSNSSI